MISKDIRQRENINMILNNWAGGYSEENIRVG